MVKNKEEDLNLDRMKTRHIKLVVKLCDSNQTHAAKKLGISLSTVRKYLEK